MKLYNDIVWGLGIGDWGLGIGDWGLGTGTPILREFVFSKSGGSEEVATGTALIKRLRGNTIVWNQLVQNGNFVDGTTGWNKSGGTTLTINNGVATLFAESTGSAIYKGVQHFTQYDVSNHKYYISASVRSNNSGNKISILLTKNNEFKQSKYSVYQSWTKVSNIHTLETSGNLNVSIRGYNQDSVDSDIDFSVKNVIVIDLTQMFGAGNEPTSVEEFESLFPLDYYEYDEGSLLSFSGDSIKTVGFNQWDEEWEVGVYRHQNGQKNDTTGNYIRSKNYIPCIPNTIYCSNKAIWYFFYDSNKNYITYASRNANTTFTTPAGCCYMTFNTNVNYDSRVYNNDICINISDPSKNGTYEPYVANTKDISFYKSIRDANDNILFPYGLLSAGSVYDEVTENKAIKRVGVVDMGSLNWWYYEPSHSFGAPVTSIKSPSNSSERNQCIICPKYTPDTQVSLNENRTDKTMLRYSTNIYIRDDSYNTDVSAFKTAMNGVYLYYELATPIEVEFEEQNLTYQVDGGGTEQLLPENTSTPTTTPARLDVNYGLDAMATLKNLQKNYLAQTDLDRLLSAMGTALGFTYTKTWDATNNQWNFTITPTNNG